MSFSNKESFIKFMEKVAAWGKESQKGLVCGIFGCNCPVEVKCSICKHGYCTEHKNSHLHQLSNFKVQ